MSDTEILDNMFEPMTTEVITDLDENSRRDSREHKFEDGTNVFRFLSALKGDPAAQSKAGDVMRAFHPIWTHRIEWRDHEDKRQWKNFRCPQKTSGKPCPLCIKLDQMKASDPSKEMEDFCYHNGPRQTFGARAINQLRPQDGVRPIFLGVGVMSDIRVAINSFRENEERAAAAKGRKPNPLAWDVTNWRAGRDFSIEKSGKGLLTKYKVTAQNPSTLVPCDEDADGKPIIFGEDGKLLPAIQTAVQGVVEAALEIDVAAEFYTAPDASKINLLLDEAVEGDVSRLLSKAESESARNEAQSGGAGGRGKGGAPRVIGAGAAKARSQLLGS